MDRSLGFLPFMDVLTGLMGIIILINIILSLSMVGDEGSKVKIVTKEADIVKVRIVTKEADIVWSKKKAKPLFVICSSNHITLNKTRIPIAKVQMQAFFHREVRAATDKWGADAYLLALIKPDGYKSFRFVRAAAIKLGLKLGYEPIDSNWEPIY